MSIRQTCMQFIFLLSILCMLCACAMSDFTDTLKQGETLDHGQAIHSQNSDYTLSFSTTAGATDVKYFLSISYPASIVWVANRDTPILDDSGFLTIDNNGALMIKQRAGNPIVLYSDDGAASSTRVATLHDNGNLVFSELHSNGSTEKILWQSFDHPTDTLLPGMLLGTVDDKRATLTSRLRKSDPSSGAFTLDWDPKEQNMIVKRRGLIVWKGGIDLSKRNWPYIKPMVSTDGNSFSYSTNSAAYLKLSEEGSLIFQIDNSKADESFVSTLDIMDMCYGYNNDKGCIKWVQPKCRSDMPTFTLQTGSFKDTNQTDLGVRYANTSVGPGDCRSICWEDCDCVAYHETNSDDDIGCLLWKAKPQLKLILDQTSSVLHVISKAAVSSPSPTVPPQPSNEGHVRSQNSSGRPERKQETLIAMMLVASMLFDVLFS